MLVFVRISGEDSNSLLKSANRTRKRLIHRFQLGFHVFHVFRQILACHGVFEAALRSSSNVVMLICVLY